MKSMESKNIIWAVDTLEEPEFQKNGEFILGALTRAMQTSVLPVHVLSYPFAQRVTSNDFEEAYTALSEKRLKELGGFSGINEMKKGVVLVNREGGRRAAVQILLSYAEEMDAVAIVASTHSRGTVSRLFMGSFAETLLLQSPFPVITVNPKSKVRERISKVLFPTDFGRRFRPAFEKAVSLCKSLDASLTLYYKEQFIPMLDPSFNYYQMLAQADDERQVEAEKWLDWAKKSHISVELKFDKSPGIIADEIVSYSSAHKFDLIILVSETSDLDGPRVGSICRQVFRSSECPVWTMKTDSFDPDDV